MNRKQMNIVEMADVVSAYMAKNSSIWQGNQAITEAVTELDGNLVVIEQLTKKQKAPVVGHAADKATVRDDLEYAILQIAAPIAALGAKTNNFTLEAQGDLTPAQVDKLAGEDLTATAQRISELATANLPALANYGIVPADITAVDTLVAQFEAVETKPREAVVDRAKETKQIGPVITSTRSLLLRQLDRAMFTYKRTQPEFHAGYESARVIVDRGNPAQPPPPPTPPTP
jgi:hypothetical protein